MSLKWKFFGMNEANAAYQSAESSIDRLLVASEITDLTVNGEKVALEKATLSQKIDAYGAVCKPGSEAQKVADLIITNDALAKAAKESEDQRLVAQATVEALQRDKVELTEKLNTANASVENLTQKLAQAGVEFKASSDTVVRLQTELNSTNSVITDQCLSVGCLEFSAETPESTKRELALQIPVKDKLASYAGAVNSAMVRLGVKSNIPSGQIAEATLAQQNVLERLNAIKDPVERTKFYRANKDAIDAAYRNK